MDQCVLGLHERCINCGTCDDRCILDYSKVCNSCRKCESEDAFCELDPEKLCDNCFRCLETEQEYAEILIDQILSE